jgi:hypothetical protein
MVGDVSSEFPVSVVRKIACDAAFLDRRALRELVPVA